MHTYSVCIFGITETITSIEAGFTNFSSTFSFTSYLHSTHHQYHIRVNYSSNLYWNAALMWWMQLYAGKWKNCANRLEFCSPHRRTERWTITRPSSSVKGWLMINHVRPTRLGWQRFEGQDQQSTITLVEGIFFAGTKCGVIAARATHDTSSPLTDTHLLNIINNWTSGVTWVA